MIFGEAQVGDAELVWPQVTVGYVGLTGPNIVAGDSSAELSDPSHRESAFGCQRAVARMTGGRPAFRESAEFSGDAQGATLAKLPLNSEIPMTPTLA